MRKLLLLFVMLNVSLVSAQTFKVGGIQYQIIDGTNTVRVDNNRGIKGSVTIPSTVDYYAVTYTVTTIGSLSFGQSTELTSIIFPNTITSIGEGAFYMCRSLTTIIIPDAVTSIENDTFSGCSGLTSITIPESVTYIGPKAFYYCAKLTDITIPESVTTIGNDAFGFCGLILLTIPNSVTFIGDGAFSFCAGIESVKIPNSITSIGNNVFYYAISLTSITIPNSVTSIGGGAFYNCTGLTSILIPDSVTSIGDGTFENCTGLTSVTIPSSVTSIGSRAFYDCTSLITVNCAVVTPLTISTNNYVFGNVNQAMCALNVPSASVNAYKAAFVWKDFNPINGVLSNENFVNKKNIKLYPNPVSNNLTIENPFSGNLQLQVFNQLGQIVLKQNQNTSSTSLDVSNLSKGIYFLNIHSENNNSQTIKFIKN